MIEDWIVRPVEVDDVPIVLLALWSEAPQLYDDHALRRLAAEITTQLQGIPQTSEVVVTGGRPRTIRVLLDPESMAARKTTALEVAQALALSNQLKNAGNWAFSNQSIILESGDFLRSTLKLNRMLVNVIDGIPVYLQDVASVMDGPGEADNYSWIEFAPGHAQFMQRHEAYPMVAISVAKQCGQRGAGGSSADGDPAKRLAATRGAD